MKVSIRTKIIVMLLGVIALYVIITLGINSVFLRVYYVNSKQSNLQESYEKITQLDYTAGKDSVDLKIELIEDSMNIQVYIIDDRMRMFYSSGGEDDVISEVSGSDGRYWFNTWVLPKNDLTGTIEIDPDLFKEKPMMTITTNTRLSTQYITLYAKYHVTDNEYHYAVINTPISAIDMSVEIYNRFALLVMVIVLIIGLFFSTIMTERIIAPFRKINQTTRKLANLNFDDRLQIESDDEVGQIAESINHMSDQLEAKIKELSIANEKLTRDIREKEAIDKMRTELISNVSHELKTPLSIIMGYCEALQLADNSEDCDYYCSIIQDEAEKMSNLSSRLLDIAELESGGAPLDLSTFDLSALAADRADKLSYLLAENNISIECTGNGNCLVKADSNRIEQVINNLLSNAMHHTPENGRIVVTVTEKVDDVEFIVYNSGSFIPEASIPHLWESFYKVDKARTRKYGGSGLGLKIVSSILDSHSLEGCKTSYAARNVADGVEFSFTLPKADIENTERADMQ